MSLLEGEQSFELDVGEKVMVTGLTEPIRGGVVSGRIIGLGRPRPAMRYEA